VENLVYLFKNSEKINSENTARHGRLVQNIFLFGWKLLYPLNNIRLNIKQLYILLHNSFSVLTVPQKQILFLYTALRDWFFVTEIECVHSAVRAGSLNGGDYALSFKV
jgi:hypothetical protein